MKSSKCVNYFLCATICDATFCQTLKTEVFCLMVPMFAKIGARGGTVV